jgi:RHS repeat-associated protein
MVGVFQRIPMVEMIQSATLIRRASLCHLRLYLRQLLPLRSAGRLGHILVPVYTIRMRPRSIRDSGSCCLSCPPPVRQRTSDRSHSNYFRDFDPATGRYVESDPIGLLGGSYSTYAYSNLNPLAFSDPTGLVPNPAEATCLVDPVQPICWGGVIADIATWIGAGAAGAAALATPGDSNQAQSVNGGKATTPAPYTHEDENEALGFLARPIRPRPERGRVPTTRLGD